MYGTISFLQPLGPRNIETKDFLGGFVFAGEFPDLQIDVVAFHIESPHFTV